MIEPEGGSWHKGAEKVLGDLVKAQASMRRNGLLFTAVAIDPSIQRLRWEIDQRIDPNRQDHVPVARDHVLMSDT